MRKSYTSLFLARAVLSLVLIFSTSLIMAQTDISIGTGSSGNGNTGYPCPLQDYYEGSRMQYLYLASELTAQGMGPGNINSLKYKVLGLANDNGNPLAIEQYSIKIGTTSASSLDLSSWETGTTVVFGPVDYTAVVGTNTFTFSSPFFWNGVDNIVVEVCNGSSSNGSDDEWTGNPEVPWTSGLSFNGSHNYRVDNSGNLCSTTSTNHSGDENTRPNIIFNWSPAAACAGMPEAGTAHANPVNVCLGQPVTLNATGVTVATGLSYQWQVSINDINWNDITGATSLQASVNQTVTSHYRFRVICIATEDTDYTASVQVTSPPLPSGVYTINKNFPTNWPASGNNFHSFADAYAAVQCGIATAVTFNVEPNTGPYNEQLIINAVPGTSDTKTITFNGNGNTISFASSASDERAVIKLKGASHIIFDSLMIDASAGTFGYGVQLMDDADSNIVRNCDIITSTTATSQNYAGIVINGTDAGPVATGIVLCDFNRFTGNTITGGYYGITLVATFAGGANGNNEFTNNDVKDFYLYGMYINGSYNTLIEHNIFSRPTRALVGEFNGIYFTGQSNTCRISKNRITNPFGGSPSGVSNFYGIFFSNGSASATNDNIVSNNLIYNINGNGPIYAIANTGSSNIWFVHNTISLDNTASTSSSATRGFQQLGTTGAIIFYDNIITITRGGNGQKHCIYLTDDLPVGIDYNDYYIKAAAGTNYVGYYNANQLTLNDWQNATAQDMNSLSRNPVYTDPANGNYSPGNAGIDNKGLFIGIDSDINDASRSQTPDIGAYEFLPPPCSIPPVNGPATLSVTTICENNPVILDMNIGAYGSGQTFQWESSSNLAGPFTPMGTPMLSPDTTIFSSSTLYYRVALSCASSTIYSDTVLLNVTPGFPGGNYTINKNLPTNYVPGVAGANFNSFNEAKNAMSSCGVLGPVVFEVEAGTGPYTEQLKMDSIRGISVTNTITFEGNGNTIAFGSSNSNERAVIKLDAADHIIFDSLIIDASSGVYGYGVQLIDNADSNTFRNCTIITSTAASALGTNYAGVVINSADAGPVVAGNTFCDANVFDKNIITGGYYGVTLVGNTGALLNDNQFTNNIIQDFYSTGFYIVGTYNTLIEGNTFTRPSRTISASPLYGIHITTSASTRLNISKNRFTNFFGGNSNSSAVFYGINHNSVNATPGNETIVSNNNFFSLGGNGSLYPLYNTGSDNVFYYHNTISLDNITSAASSISAGFYQTNSASGIQFKDNIVTVNMGGSGEKYAVYLATTSSEVELNNNNYYINPGNANGFIGFDGSGRLNLANWQAASGQDANSLNVDPLYIDLSNGNLKPAFFPLDNKGVSVGITTDILNVDRSTSTPDMGAYEFEPVVCVSPPVAGAAVVTPATGLCLETPIHLNLSGNSAPGTITFQWQHSSNGTDWTDLGDLQYTPKLNTTATTNTYYRAAVTCNGVTVYSDVAQVTLNDILQQGTYTIDKNNPTTWPSGTNFNSFGSAVNAMLCGITGPVVFNVVAGTYTEQVRIPYIRNTSATNTVTFQSENGMPGSATLSFNSTTAASNYTLKLDSAEHFIFKNLTLSATNPAFGRVIELANTASYDSIVNCSVTGPTVSVATNNITGIYSDGSDGINNVIKGNSITNGSIGIYFSGTSSSAMTKPGHLIEDNHITNSYSHGIFVQYTNGILVKGNTVDFDRSPAGTTGGIWANYADSASRITSNTIDITNVTSGPLYGIYITNTRASMNDSMMVAGNKVVAGSGNTNSLYGLLVSASKSVSVINNVVAINSAGTIAQGLISQDNVDEVNFYNNTVNIQSSSSDGYSAYFTQNIPARFNVLNNIFSNNGGGKALYVNNPAYFSGDYNMLYATGSTLVEVATGTVTSFPSLQAWTNTWNWDQSSISFAPAFVSNTDLQPDLNNADVWAMHGRGIQIKGNTYDFTNNYRPDSLTAGVPDLGAYEFYPNVQPSVLLATPAIPAPNSTQIFSYGTDTVMKITWAATAPSNIEVRRFSGVVPSGLLPGTDSMFFYTKVDIPGGANYNYAAKLYYIDSWQGSIPQQKRLGLGRTTPSNAWVVGSNSKIDIGKKEISQESIAYLDRFTGLINPFAQPEPEDSNSNRGKDFWIGYQRTNGFADGNDQIMKLYFGAGSVPANVTVTIEGTTGTPWVRNYFVPANSALASDDIPNTGTDDARLENEGLYAKRSIHIVSDVPIVAYAHTYEVANSGATMLMPTAVWGYEYYVLTSRQNYTSTSYSAFHIVAQEDSTWVEINPSKPTRGGWVHNGGTLPNGSYLVKLNKGDAYQVLGEIESGIDGYDLTGSYVKSIANGQGECHPIAVFSGSTRTGIGCGTSAGSSGDLIVQQIFPYQAWGNKYVTAPTSNDDGPNASSNMTNTFRVMVKDPTTIVKRNNVVLSNLIDNRYYQYESNTADYIESNKPVLVAQYMSSSSSCPNTSGDGDPEMFYLSPLQQAIKATQFYRNDQDAIDENFITLVIPTQGLESLKIDGINYQAYSSTEVYTYDHPNLPGYSIVTKKWDGGAGSSTAESNSPFTGVVYGLGSVESYGYNLGTLVKNLNNLSSVDNVLNTGATPTEYTCKGALFTVKALLPVQPDSIRWLISAVPKLSPSADILQADPVSTGTQTVNGIDYYEYSLTQQFVLDTAGTFTIPIEIWSPEIESCDHEHDGKVIVQVLPAPITDFAVTFDGGRTDACEGDVANFTGDLVTQNGIALNEWKWTFHDGTTSSGQDQTFTYPTAGTYDVSLEGITADGCVSDTIRQIVVNPKPVVAVTEDSIGICAGADVTFTVSDPDSAATYNWYNDPTGGTTLFTGDTYLAAGVTPPQSFYVEEISSAGCISESRTKVDVFSLASIPPPVVTVGDSGADFITFNWNPVPGTTSYEVSVDGGGFVTPSSGPTGLTHTVSGLGTLQSVNLVVKAINDCGEIVSTDIDGCTNSMAAVVEDSLETCNGSNAVFDVQSPASGITYTWYSDSTGGASLATGNSFVINNVTATANYYLQHQSDVGCIGTPRTKLVVSVLPPLPQITAAVDSAATNLVRFKWNAVPGAASYEISTDNGATFTTPSSGPTGLTHTVTNLIPMQEVTLIVRAIGAVDCQTSASAAVTGRALGDDIFIPNTFTPNGDGVNDQLKVYSTIIQQSTFMVFDQWGEKIYESKDLSVAWDGTYKGRPQPSGVYMYVAKFVLRDGTIVNKKGAINLIR